LAQIRYTGDGLLGLLADRIEPRKTSNPLVAAAWGAADTRDLIIQFYLTLQRMAEGRVSPTNLMGPIGIVSAGSRIAYKGNDWLLWFLAMISANLAVVNFLPIPIVDGGLFVFLILEKLMGRPLSPRTQSIAQVVGLALILSVFLFVTYQDITRFF
jgi:regulator of sigma E protease